MNSDGESQTISEAQTAKTFEQPEYRFLIVANKCQTGFDQPLLHTMYVDKKHDFRGQLTDYARLYTFAAQVLSFADADLDKLYVFARTAMLRI